MNEIEAKTVLYDLLDRYRKNPYEQLYDAARVSERIDGEVPGPASGALYPITIATQWAEEPEGNIRVIIVVHDKGANYFDPLKAVFEKTPENTLV